MTEQFLSVWKLSGAVLDFRELTLINGSLKEFEEEAPFFSGTVVTHPAWLCLVHNESPDWALFSSGIFLKTNRAALNRRVPFQCEYFCSDLVPSAMHPAHLLECGARGMISMWWRLLPIHHPCPPSLTSHPSLPLSPRDTLHPRPSHFLLRYSFTSFHFCLPWSYFLPSCPFPPSSHCSIHLLRDFHVKVLPYSWLITSFWNMSKTRTKTSLV